MPDIKIKNIISFSSEDKVHKAENLLKPETYRKWKCATPGEKNASVLLQLEKATQIHSIDIGNEHSAFVEVLVGRSSASNEDYKVLLVASSFMSPLESRNGTNVNRVRMFGPDKLSQNLKDEKWDVIQIVCTQPFNKTVQYGLTFVTFHSPPEPHAERTEASDKPVLKFGAFQVKSDEEEVPLSVGNLFQKQKEKRNELSTSPSAIRQASSFAAAVLNSHEEKAKAATFPISSMKRKHLDEEAKSLPPSKKESPAVRVNREKVGYKNILGDTDTESKIPFEPKNLKPESSPKSESSTRAKIIKNSAEMEVKKKMKKKPLNQIMDKVVFVLSGFQNPVRGNIRDCALDMGAKYKADWDSSCTHLICAFLNTPKYNQVRSNGGRIVTQNWIFDSYKKKELLPWRKYMLGKYSKATTSEEEEEEEEEEDDDDEPSKGDLKTKMREKLKNQKSETPESATNHNNIVNKPSSSKTSSSPVMSTKSSVSGNDDGDSTGAESDYLADTDVDSDGDTEDEITRVENQNRNDLSQEKVRSPESKYPKKSKTEDSIETKPDTSNLELPELPDFFKKKHFFLYGSFSEQEKHDLERYITAYNGVIADYMGDNVKYVLTYSKWNQNFDEALAENENLIFVHPKWIYKCHEKSKLVPFQPHIIVPEE